MGTFTARHSLYILSLLLTLGVEQASAQAMVSYGHGVAKAAGAGAAVGGGVGGVLTGMGNPLSQAAGKPGGSSASGRAATQRQVVPQRKGPVKWEVAQVETFGGPAPLGLVGGVRATGAAQADWQPTLLAPSQNLAVINATWGGAELSEGAIAPTEERTAQAPVESAQQPEAAAAAKAPVIVRSAGFQSRRGGTADPKAATLPEGISVGLTVDQLVEKLGRPRMSFRGVAGAGYTDQFIYRLPDGTDLVVYVLDGIVSQLAVT